MTARPAVAVIGTSRVAPEHAAFEAQAHQLGASLPPDRMTLRTGACGGFPDALGAGFRAAGGTVVGYSPGRDLDDHVAGGSPTGTCDELLFGFGGLIEREIAMLKSAQAVLALGGNVGTLSELCMAVKLELPLLIAAGFPGVSAGFLDILGPLKVYPQPRIQVLPVEALGPALLDLVLPVEA